MGIIGEEIVHNRGKKVCIIGEKCGHNRGRKCA